MFNYLFDFVENQNGQFQIIVVDHANLDDAKFQDGIVEEWRDNLALVPYDWFDDNKDLIEKNSDSESES